VDDLIENAHPAIDRTVAEPLNALRGNNDAPARRLFGGPLLRIGGVTCSRYGLELSAHQGCQARQCFVLGGAIVSAAVTERARILVDF
jgi:hypothetical protein